MSIYDFLRRVNGFSISTPVGGGGIQWDNRSTDKDKETARRVITFLEDRRVLYVEGQLEVPKYCIKSIFEIREFLTNTICNLPLTGNDKEMTVLEISLREMRSACQMALTTLQALGLYVDFSEQYGSNYATRKEGIGDPNYDFVMALVTLRTVFAININKISKRYEVPVRDNRLQVLIDSYMSVDIHQKEEKNKEIYQLKNEIVQREDVIKRQTEELDYLRDRVSKLERRQSKFLPF